MKGYKNFLYSNSMQTTLWLPYKDFFLSMHYKSNYLAKLYFICTSRYCQIAKISNCDFKIWAKFSFLDKPQTLKGNDF